MTREIDARVAREVMGREVETRTHDGQEYLFEFVGAEREGYRLLDQLLPSYSEDMNAAMEVVVVVCGSWDKFELHYEPGRWFAIFSRSCTDERIAVGADTPTEAICLAALEAVKK